MSSNSEYIDPIANDSPATSSPDDEIDSLPDSAPSDDIDNDEEEEESDAEKEWKESLQQLELILTMVLVPYAGKYFGRKCAYWGELECCDRGAQMRLCPVVGGADHQKGGRNSWSGSTRLKWSIRARGRSKQQELSQPALLYDCRSIFEITHGGGIESTGDEFTCRGKCKILCHESKRGHQAPSTPKPSALYTLGNAKRRFHFCLRQ